MTKRLDTIFAEIPPCESFADIGCDHGYITQLMFKHAKCQRAYINDVSEKCLNKAKKLLDKQIKEEKCFAFVADGFKGVPKPTTALIAGMGGEEIIKILSSADYCVENLVLQPMKNPQAVRAYLIGAGYKIDKDYIFKADGKFYNLIKASRGSQSLTEKELEFGLTNVANQGADFKEWLNIEIDKLERVAMQGGLSLDSLQKVNQRIKRLKDLC